jgi:hypothetical protein
MNYLHAAVRFWWIILVGVATACITGMLLVYHVDRLWPPQFSKKAQPVFSASTELLVDSPSGPYLRTVVSKQATGTLRTLKSGQTSTTPATTPETAVTGTKPLVDAANLFPLFIESDAVYAIRRKLVGDIPGAVHAKALYSLQGATRFRPSVVPVVQISAIAPKPKFALALTQGTTRAFELWLEREQTRSKIPPSQRIIVRQLRVPRVAVATGGPSYGLPALASLGVLALFAALAFLLDQRLPRTFVVAEPRPVAGVGGSAPEPVERGGLAFSSRGPGQPLA